MGTAAFGINAVVETTADDAIAKNCIIITHHIINVRRAWMIDQAQRVIEGPRHLPLDTVPAGRENKSAPGLIG